MTEVLLRFPVDQLSTDPPKGSNRRKVVLAKDAVIPESLVGIPVRHLHSFTPDSRVIGQVVMAQMRDQFVYLWAQCTEAPAYRRCSWALTDVHLEDSRARIWKVLKCIFTEIAIVEKGAFETASVIGEF